jgi:hypothetical protein
MTRSLATADVAAAGRLLDVPSNGAPLAAPAKSSTPVPRLYTAPRLRFLGSVRELTLGSGAFCSDGANGQPVPDICDQ